MYNKDTEGKKMKRILAIILVFCFSTINIGCVAVLGGALIGAGVASAHKKTETGKLEQELSQLEKDYKDGKISADAYWVAKSQLISQMENIKTNKEIANKQASTATINELRSSQSQPTEPSGPVSTKNVSTKKNI